MTGQTQNRSERRKAQTRAALVGAAQVCIAEGRTNISILELTRIADVGLGSFYNYFETKEQLFQVAVEEALETFFDALDTLADDIEDPAEVFAQSFRLSARLLRRQPELGRVPLRHGLSLISSGQGLARRARRDIEAAVRAGRFPAVRDLDLALAVATGATLTIGQLLHDDPGRDDAEAADLVAEDLLRMFGVPADEAHDICQRHLPDPEAVTTG
jgi:AcrR family transcriptional regulator